MKCRLALLFGRLVAAARTEVRILVLAEWGSKVVAQAHKAIVDILEPLAPLVSYLLLVCR